MSGGNGPGNLGHPSGQEYNQGEVVAVDPSIAPGLPRPEGWRVLLGTGLGAWDKFGPNDTDWTPVGSPSPGGGVDKIIAGDGISVSPAAGTGNVTIAQVLAASWALPVSNAAPNIRWYALDGVNGDDTRVGFSDVSMADAGTKAVKTAAVFNAMVPIDGRGRNIVLAINASDYAAASSVLMGRVGYCNFICRATVTDATAGSTAFLDDANDRDMNGNITATGMNAAGYNPTGAPTTRTIQCLKVGGAAPGFPAEVPISLPGGARLRFDINTTTAGLRGVRRTIVQVTGGDTLVVDKLLPAVAVASDTFYIEMPGAKFTVLRMNLLNGPDNGGYSHISGLQSNGAVAGARDILVQGNVNLAQCWFTGAQASALRGTAVSVNSVYQNVDGTNQETGGACRSNGLLSFSAFTQFAMAVGTGPYCNALSFSRGGSVEIETAFVAVAGVVYNRVLGTAQNTTETDPDCIGTNAIQIGNGYNVCRIIGPGTLAGLTLGAFATISGLDITGMGVKPAIMLTAAGLGVVITGPLSGTTGNTDVGLDLRNAQGCTIYVQTLPTVTGVAGDVRLAGGQIITWAQAMLGIVDSAGNRIVGTSAPLAAFKFSGTLVGGAGAVLTYLTDAGLGLAANLVTRPTYPTSQRLLTRLRVTPVTNTMANAVTATLYKNGVATAMTVSIPAGTTAKVVDSAHPILFADGDDFDLRLDDAAADAGHLVNVSAVLEYPN